jgi:protein-S-isoprenylcysteine O-methyltransferase Ste14
MRRHVLVWGDVAFYLAVLVVAIVVAPRTRYWIAGIALAAIAFPLWVTARIQLGSAFSFRAEARRLVTTGLYSKIRHPVYFFGTAAAVGSFLALQVWLLFWAMVALGGVTLLRIRKEDRVLHEAFGEEYDEYRRRTWF